MVSLGESYIGTKKENFINEMSFKINEETII